MLSVSNVSMRYGAKVLFEDVSASPFAGTALRTDGAQRFRQVHLYEGAHRRTGGPKG